MSNDNTKTSDTVEQHFFRASAADFKKIPGSPIAYDMPEKLLQQYSRGNLIKDYVDAKSGQNTGDNNRFIRYWF